MRTVDEALTCLARENATANAMGVLYCRGIHVRPYPQPLGNDGKVPLLSSNADTFHAANAHRGTTVRDCYFVNAGKKLTCVGVFRLL